MEEVEDIVVERVLDKVSKTNKPFWTILSHIPSSNNEKRTYNVFDAIVAQNLKENVGKVCAVEQRQNGNFWNISKFLTVRVSDAENVADQVAEDEAKEKPVSRETSIVAQCLTKCTIGQAGASEEKVLETYKYFLENL